MWLFKVGLNILTVVISKWKYKSEQAGYFEYLYFNRTNIERTLKKI